MSRVALALDIGGSFVKAGLVSAAGLTAEFAPVAVDADGDAGSILSTFAEVIRTGLAAADRRVAGIGIAMPGPFDYARGVSRMTRKFAGLNGVDLRAALCGASPETAALPLRFRHDANAFLEGELWQGAGRGVRRGIGVTLGTGIGVSCRIDGTFINTAQGSPAPEVSVWSRPYKDGIVEDFISTKGLVTRYRRARPEYDPAGGVKGIAEAAKAGDLEAVRVFVELGSDLGAVLLPLCERFDPERIIFGGQIAKDFALFAESVNAGLGRAAQPPLAVMGSLGNRAALIGVAREVIRLREPVSGEGRKG